MAGNTVVLEFAGDAAKLAKETQKANKDVESFGNAARSASNDLAEASKANDDYVTKIGKLGAAVDGASTAIDDAAGTVQAFADIQSASSNKVQAHERALNDVRQAQEDYSQALRDGKQAALDSDQAEIDLEQARLDQKVALEEYNKAVKEFGANSNEARQAQIDLKQAGADVNQALEDQQQATRDASQATIDAKGAQLDLNEAQKEANPPDIQKWANDIALFTPILTGLTGVVGLVTAAQWAWNAAQLASPTTWIVLAIGALIAIIVLIATKTDWFQKLWRNAWGWIKDAAKNTWDFLAKIPGWIGDAFKKIAGFITWPFRTAFNFIADAWNNTIGRLSFTVPDWVPVIGGNNISVPNIPKFHGGISSVPGAPGSEMLAILQAGERVSSAGSSNSTVPLNITLMLDSEVIGRATGDYVQRNGGNVQVVLAGSR